MAYGSIKVDTLTWDDSGSDANVTVGTIPTATQLNLKADKAGPTFTGDVTLTGASANAVFDASDNALEFADNAKIVLGTGSDLTIWHNATNSLITGTGTGGLIIDGGTSGLKLQSLLKEKVNITAGKLSDNTGIDLEDGMVHYFSTAETTTCTPNIRVSSSVSLDSAMATGETITVTVITTAAAAGFSAQWQIDSSAVTEEWNGGSAPSAGGSSGLDVYTLNIIKTGSSTFKVLANVSNFD